MGHRGCNGGDGAAYRAAMTAPTLQDVRPDGRLLGWVIHPDIGGLFVEHIGPTVADVERQIALSDRPACALVLAAYALADWSTP